MRFNTHINNQKAIEWGLNSNQAALFDLLNQLSSWAKDVTIDGEVFYWVSRNRVVEVRMKDRKELKDNVAKSLDNKLAKRLKPRNGLA